MNLDHSRNCNAVITVGEEQIRRNEATKRSRHQDLKDFGNHVKEDELEVKRWQRVFLLGPVCSWMVVGFH